MINKYSNRNIHFTVRMNNKQRNMLNKNSSYYHLSKSNYLLKLMENDNKKNSNKRPIRPVSKHNLQALKWIVSHLSDELHQFYLDYARALSNLEHDNNLYNHGQLQNIPRETLEATKSAVISNKNELHRAFALLNKMEMNLYDH